MGYPLTNVTWLCRGLRRLKHWGECFLLSSPQSQVDFSGGIQFASGFSFAFDLYKTYTSSFRFGQYRNHHSCLILFLTFCLTVSFLIMALVSFPFLAALFTGFFSTTCLPHSWTMTDFSIRNLINCHKTNQGKNNGNNKKRNGVTFKFAIYKHLKPQSNTCNIVST